MKLISSLILSIIMTLAASAPEPFTGTLHNTKGQPIKGAILRVNDSKAGIKTGIQGAFRLDNADTGDILHIEFRGKTHEFCD